MKLVFAQADHLDKDYCDGHLLVVWEHIKWYKEHSDVIPIQNFIAECLEDPTKEDQIRFVRLGENCDDVEEFGFAFDDIYVSRAVHY